MPGLEQIPFTSPSNSQCCNSKCHRNDSVACLSSSCFISTLSLLCFPSSHNLFILILHPNFSLNHQGLPKNGSPSHFLKARDQHHHCFHFLGDSQEHQAFPKCYKNGRKKGSSQDNCPKALSYILCPFLNESFGTQPFIFPEEFSAEHLIIV